MTTPREQAREAVVDAAWEGEGPRRWPESVEYLADIASDVWEPEAEKWKALCQDMYGALRHVVGSTFPGEHLDSTYAALERAKEALES